MKTVSRWIQQQEFESEQDGHLIKLDGRVENGFSPKALLLAGLAGCTGIDVVEILQKMRISFSDLRIEASAEQTDTTPKVFKDIELTYYLRTAQENEQKVKKAIELSLESYCGVASMLRKNSNINYTLVLQ
jgi:putative redox protein